MAAEISMMKRSMKESSHGYISFQSIFSRAVGMPIQLQGLSGTRL